MLQRPGTRRPYYELVGGPPLTETPGGGAVPDASTGGTTLHVTFLAQSTAVDVNDTPGTAATLPSASIGRLAVDAASAGTAQLEEDGVGPVGPAIVFDGAGIYVGDPATIAVAGMRHLRCTGTGTVKNLALLLGGVVATSPSVDYPYCLSGSAPAGWASDFGYADTDALIGAHPYHGGPGTTSELAGSGTTSGALQPPNGPPAGSFPDMLSQGPGSCAGGSTGKLYYGWASGLQLGATGVLPPSADGWIRARVRSTLGSDNRMPLLFLGADDGQMTGLGIVRAVGGDVEWETWDAGGPVTPGGTLGLGGPLDVVLRVVVTDGGRSLTAYAWAGAVSASGEYPTYRGSYSIPQAGYDPGLPEIDNPAPITAVVDARGMWASSTIGFSGASGEFVGSVTWELCEYVRGEDDPDPFGLLATITP